MLAQIWSSERAGAPCRHGDAILRAPSVEWVLVSDAASDGMPTDARRAVGRRDFWSGLPLAGTSTDVRSRELGR